MLRGMDVSQTADGLHVIEPVRIVPHARGGVSWEHVMIYCVNTCLAEMPATCLAVRRRSA